jgi:glutamyl-Q tRNA(Asp) synthetase
MIVSRFAPSPTGRLHLGHAFSALTAHRFARAAGGRFLLRIEDIDAGRCREDHVDGILEDLAWLGIDWDGPLRRQSAHMDDYAAALGRLRAAGVVYPCFCTRRDIAAAAQAPHGAEDTRYPGTCRRLGAERQRQRAATGSVAWRLDSAAAGAMTGPLDFYDRGGRIAVDATLNGDVVVARKDAGTSYHLAVVTDDALQGVTDVVRGEDLRPATHVHRLLQALLGLPAPRYHHHRLLVGTDGRRLAKRDRAETLAALRAAGLAAATVRQRLGFT